MLRIWGVLRHPRSTMAALVAAPSWLTAWALILTIWLVPAGWLLSTSRGQQALVDERVRRVEAFGGTVTDAEYDGLRRSPPVAAYFTSGGRLLLLPPVTLLAACLVALLARRDGALIAPAAAVAIAVHASVVLALQQVVAAPLSYLRESLASATTLAVAVPALDDGSFGARVLGAVDVFGLWWVWLLAVGIAAGTGRPARRYAGRFLVVYGGVAAGLALLMAWSGGF